MKIAFVCCTPYQVFNSINYIFNHQSVYYDMFICNHFNYSDIIYQNLRTNKLIQNCYYVTSGTKRSVLQRLYLAVKSDIKEISNCRKNIFYDEIIIGTYNDPTTAIFYKFCKRYKKKLSIIDEGIGSYYFENIKKCWKHKYIRSLLGHVIRKKYICRYLLYVPSAFTGDSDVCLESLSKLDRRNSELKNILNQIFSYNCEMKPINGKVIFFDQPLDYYVYENNNITQEKFCHCMIRKIKSIVKDKDLMIKWHPRTESKIRQQFINYNYAESSLGGWELDLLNGAGGNIYITICSSAVLLGNMIFGDDDIIILLNKIESYYFENFENLLKKLESHKRKIFQPTSWDEFSDLLKTYYSLLNNNEINNQHSN